MGRAEELFERIEGGGIAAIRRLVDERASEELFLDFKTSANAGAGPSLNADDSKNLSKAISGFGNAEGGVLIWGIDCREDRATGQPIVAETPLANARAFRSNLENAISRLSVPPHSLVRNCTTLNADGTTGFVTTLIPKADFAPIRAIAHGLQRYYLRAGSSFSEVPHDALAGLFGRRPQPTLWPQFLSHPVRRQMQNTPFATLGIGLYNNGPNLAERPYLSLHPLNQNSQKCLFVQPSNGNRFDQSVAAIKNVQVVARPEIVIAPGGLEDVCSIMLSLADVTTPILFELVLGAGNAGPARFKLEAPVDRLEAARDAGLAGSNYTVAQLYGIDELIKQFTPA